MAISAATPGFRNDSVQVGAEKVGRGGEDSGHQAWM